MVLDMAKKRARRGRPKKPPMERLSERFMIRLTPELAAWVDVIRKQKAEAAGVELESIQIQEAVRELMKMGAVAMEAATRGDSIQPSPHGND